MTAPGTLFCDASPAGRVGSKNQSVQEPDFQLTRRSAPPRPEVRSIAEIQPLPALKRCGLLPTEVQLTDLRECGDELFDEPLVITESGFLIDGHKRWMIARERGVPELACLILHADSDEALCRVLERARSRNWLNAYCRIELALCLEQSFLNKAKDHQRAAGCEKQLAKLPEAERIDVRKELARLAGCSEGSVRKVRFILSHGIRRLQEESRRGSITIHAAWKVAKLRSDDQERELAGKATKKRQARRVSQQLARAPVNAKDVPSFLAHLLFIHEQVRRCKDLAHLHAMCEQFIPALKRQLDAISSQAASQPQKAA
jgi:ParB-like chromosome segregation protein Spo0J